MEEMWTRFTTDMAARFGGPMSFRLVLQPSMAAFFAIRSGLADARAGRPPFFWSFLTGSAPRKTLIESVVKSVGRVFIFAIVMDVIYQLYVEHWVYIPQLLAVAFLLAIVPYVVLRGLVTRFARVRSHSKMTAPRGGTPTLHH